MTIGSQKNYVQDWIPSHLAFAMTIARTGSEKAATELLNKRLFDEGFQARASSFAEQVNFGQIPKQIPIRVSNTTTRIRILPEGKHACLYMSAGSDAPAATRPYWVADWKAGSFAVIHQPIPILFRQKSDGRFSSPVGKRTVFFDVEFVREEIHQFALSIPRAISLTSNLRGPRKKKWIFAPVLADLEASILDGRMEKKFGRIDDYGVLAKIERYIIAALRVGDDEPPETTVRRHAHYIIGEWRRNSLRGK